MRRAWPTFPDCSGGWCPPSFFGQQENSSTSPMCRIDLRNSLSLISQRVRIYELAQHSLCRYYITPFYHHKQASIKQRILCIIHCSCSSSRCISRWYYYRYCSFLYRQFLFRYHLCTTVSLITTIVGIFFLFQLIFSRWNAKLFHFVPCTWIESAISSLIFT